jgi:hypothetical protein
VSFHAVIHQSHHVSLSQTSFFMSFVMFIIVIVNWLCNNDAYIQNMVHLAGPLSSFRQPMLDWASSFTNLMDTRNPMGSGLNFHPWVRV